MTEAFNGSDGQEFNAPGTEARAKGISRVVEVVKTVDRKIADAAAYALVDVWKAPEPRSRGRR